nr:TerC family protein [Propionibacterium sp.]
MITTTTWILTVAFVVGLLLFDFVFHVRKAHAPTIREAALWTSIYVSVALSFGAFVWLTMGAKSGMEYYAGYITEMSLSVDNLFVFLIIMASFKVPRADQQKVLMFGIVVSLIMRSLFIFLGVALINAFSWVFYIFGLILLWTAVKLLKPESGNEEDEANNVVIKLARRFIHISDHYDGDKLFTIVDGKKAMTPMLLVMVAIGGTDVMFALDSIPAIFGLTQNGYIVFTAVAFSLMGLRQLYFLLDGLLDRLIYLKYGLAVILGFIGVKLILHALHENSLPFINGGQHLPVPEISTQLSLGVIVASLLVTVVASLLSPKGKVLTLINNTRRHAIQYLDLEFEEEPAIREQTYGRLMAEEQLLKEIPERYAHLLGQEQELIRLLDESHRRHGDYREYNPAEFVDKKPHHLGEPLDTTPFRREDSLGYREGMPPELVKRPPQASEGAAPGVPARSHEPDGAQPPPQQP